MSRTCHRWFAVPAALLVAALLGAAPSARATTAGSVAGVQRLSHPQRATLLAIARDTGKFYATDVDPNTHLPMDNVTFAGGSSAPTSFGRYTSASNLGVYLWAVVAAHDLGIISTARADRLAGATLGAIARLKR